MLKFDFVVVNDNNNKDDDIKKLHEIVENFKQMFEELNVQVIN